MSILRTSKLRKEYGGQAVVNDIDLEFNRGTVSALLGRNGAGKTTTFLMIAGIVPPDGGSVFFAGKDITCLPAAERAGLGLVYLPQEHSVFVKTTVLNNLFMILELKYDQAEARQKAELLLEDFGLLTVRDSMAYHLSGGEKRRLEIARAMIQEPAFLFLDEPFTGIDPITILEIQKVLLKLKERGMGIIITDHNVVDTFFISDRAYIIHQGDILSSGSPAELVREKLVRKLFLGEDFVIGRAERQYGPAELPFPDLETPPEEGET